MTLIWLQPQGCLSLCLVGTWLLKLSHRHFRWKLQPVDWNLWDLQSSYLPERPHYHEFSKPWRRHITGHIEVLRNFIKHVLQTLVFRCLIMILKINPTPCQAIPISKSSQWMMKIQGHEGITIFPSAGTTYGHCCWKYFHVLYGTASGSSTSPFFISTLIVIVSEHLLS